MMKLTMLALCGIVAPVFAASPPNIVVILSDDVGYSDIGCYGGEIQTPHLDSLARSGLRFTQFYNTARCCPTRASLLTGLHPHQAGIGHMMEDRGFEGYRGNLNRRCVTIAEALKPAGYRNYAVGKWHVTPGMSVQTETKRDQWPRQRGFDRFYGTIHGAGSYFDPSSLVRDDSIITAFSDPEYTPEKYYYTDAIADHAVRFVKEHAERNAGEPFFLYVAFTAAHWPLHAKDKDIARYKGKYDSGYEPIRQTRLARQRELGLIDPSWKPAPLPQAWSEAKDKAFESRCMEVYAAQIDSMDQGIGRIVETLRELHQLENTLIFYLQDNGACAEEIGRQAKADPPSTERRFPPMKPSDRQYNSIPKQTRDGRPVRGGSGVMPGGEDTYIAYGKGWASVSNTPFREYKHWTHEGGISTPLIVHWPAGIQMERRGRLEKQPGQLVDIMATCLDAAKASYPAVYREQEIKPLQGASLLPALRGQPIPRRNPLFWEHEGNRAVRDGAWKLVAKENRDWELYHLEKDRTESANLAGQHPEIVGRLSAAWEEWARKSDVLPLGAWRSPLAPAKHPNHRKLRFVLKPGDDLSRDDSPDITGRRLTITGRLQLDEWTQGVVVAQGGRSNGYAVFLQDRKLHAFLRRPNRTWQISSGEIPPGTRSFIVRIESGKRLSLEVDGKLDHSELPEGFRLSTPVEGLQVGRDNGAPVGPYSSPHPFNGKLEQLEIVLEP